jgi:predicted ATPase
MIFKSIELENACGYRRGKFDLHKNLNMFFGPNGCGKSNLLYMANILASPTRFQGRDVSMLFRKMIHHKNYNPGYQAYDTFENVMWMKGTFIDKEGKEYVVEVEIDPKNVEAIDELAKDSSRQAEYLAAVDKVGIVRNELPDDQLERAFLSDADNPANLSKFQIEAKAGETFLDIAKAVYGYDCYLPTEKSVEEYDKQTNEHVTYYTDFVIVKDDDGAGFEPVRVHYRRMSDGERKIATLLKQICSPMQRDRLDIYLVDNIEMHIYMARHTKLVDKLLYHFPDKQFLATSHSPILVGLKGVIEPYLSKEHLHDVIETRRNSAMSEASVR